MSDFYYIHKLMNLKDFIIKNVQILDSLINVYVELPIQVHKCPSCATPTSFVHDYRVQKIKDVPIYLKPTFLHYRKRRYICPHCRKKFYENNSFVARYQHMSGRLRIRVLESLRSTRSMASIAKDIHVSSPTIGRILSGVQKGNMPTLPNVLSIDEFKGDTSFGKYQCIVTNPEAKKTLDILPTRNELSLRAYFRRFSLYQRKQVSHIVIDMWRPYYTLMKDLFPDATIVIDRFHYVRQCTWALENVRKRIQKNVSTKDRKWFKRSKKILLKKSEKISFEETIQLRKMFMIAPELEAAYDAKENFYYFLEAESREEAAHRLDIWIEYLKKLDMKEFNACITTFTNWRNPILNSFTCPYTNGFTEGFNNKIKVIKRNAYGFRDFHRFRNRILLNT